MADPKIPASLLMGGEGPMPAAPDKADEGRADEAPLDAAASDLIDAVKSGDASGVKDALRVAFQFLEMKGE